MWTLYRIACNTPNHFYIGISEQPNNRIQRHKEGRGAEFTKIHGVRSADAIATYPTIELAKEGEKQETLRLKKIPGVVARGAGWTVSNGSEALYGQGKFDRDLRVGLKAILESRGVIKKDCWLTVPEILDAIERAIPK